jgi:hypothetical protein
MAPFAVVGLGFSLATLRVIARQVGNATPWMCALAGLTLACASVVPYILRFPQVYHEAIAAGYCFTMIGVWLAASAIAARRSSLARLATMSLCFGLAAGSRPTLGLAALLLIPVYASLRTTRSRRGLLAVLTVPVGVCFVLLATYNQARYGNPLEVGTHYQINNGNYHAHWAEVSYIPLGVWSYLVTPPRLSVLFPFLSIIAPQRSYPLNLPAFYARFSEPTGGSLAMTPIVIFLVALPWTWRRRPARLGSLGPLLLAMAGVGILIMLFLSYEFFGTTERYEVDYATLLVFGALAVWLAFSAAAQGRRRRLIQLAGALLAIWSCVTGLAITYQELQTHPGTWRTLVSLGSPVSSAIAFVAGHPVLAEVYTPNVAPGAPETYGNIGTTVSAFWLSGRDQADLTIVSPDSREATLAADVLAGPALGAGAPLEVHLRGPGGASSTYRVAGGDQAIRLTARLTAGVNVLVLTPGDGEAAEVTSAAPPGPEPESQALVRISNLHVLGG